MNALNQSAALVLLALTAGGCLVNSRSATEQSGTYVAPETLAQIQPGQTRREWVSAVLGAPTSVIAVDPRTEIWRYSYTETKDSSGAVFLIFRGSDRKVTNSGVYVEIKDGVVSRTWRG